MSRRPARRHETGLSYIEVLVATVLVALALVPAMEALEGAIRGSGVAELEARRQHAAAAKLEEVLAESVADLEAEAMAAGAGPSAYSDPAGSPDRRLVFLNGFDADGDAADDPGIVHVRVEIEATGHVLESLAGF